MNTTIVICTHNRCDLLLDTLNTVSRQTYPTNCYDVLIIDNKSTDNTFKVVNDFANRHKTTINYIYESRQGLSHARNTGIINANGELIVFIDDDIDADSKWLHNLTSAFDSDDVLAAGGPIRPIWPKEKPEWINSDSLLEPLTISEFTEARDTGYFPIGKGPFGANMAFRRKIFDKYGLFPIQLGRKGKILLSNEEIELCNRIHSDGGKIRFIENAFIYHKIDSKRLRKHWYYHRFYWQGHSDAILASMKKVNSYEFLVKQLPNLLTLHANRSKLDFQTRCQYYHIKGYLHQLLFRESSETCSNFRKIRTLEVLLYSIAQHQSFETTCADNLSNNIIIKENNPNRSLSSKLTSLFRCITDFLR